MVTKEEVKYLIKELQHKKYFEDLYDSNVIDMNDYFKASKAIEKTDMTLGITAPFYNTKADRLANHKNNINDNRKKLHSK